MNIYLRELKAHRKSLFLWSVVMVFLIVASMGKYSAGIGDGASSFNELVSQLPPSWQRIFGVGVFDLSTAIGYIGALYLYIVLVAAIHAVMLGCGILSKEERDKTAEFLLTRPVTRTRVVTAKLLAALTMVLVLNLVTLLATYLFLEYYADQPFLADLLKLMGGMLALQVLFGAVGAFAAGVTGSYKRASGAATGVLLLSYVLSIVVDIAENWEPAAWLTPFQYYDAKDLLVLGYNPAFPAITAVLVLLLLWGAYHYYRKRDLRV